MCGIAGFCNGRINRESVIHAMNAARGMDVTGR